MPANGSAVGGYKVPRESSEKAHQRNYSLAVTGARQCSNKSCGATT